MRIPRQLFYNLIDNGLKFHRSDVPPVVEIEGQFLNGATLPPLADGPAAGYCQITVKDNGIGFDQKHVDRIFSIFQRLHGQGQFAGTGIGLALCSRIVDRHQGRIEAKGAPGHGAEFVVTLPLNQTRGEGMDGLHQPNHDDLDG